MGSEMQSFFKLEKLNHGNYMPWAFKMKMLLQKENVWDTISEDALIPATEAWATKEMKALHLIVFSCENNQLVHLRKCLTGKQAWICLKSHHQQVSLGTKIRMMKKLFKKTLHPGGSMREHLDEFFELFDHLSEIESALPEAISVTVILSSLGDEYDALVTAIEAWSDDRLTIESVKSKLIDEWEKRGSCSRSVSELSSGVNAMTVKNGFVCFECGKTGHFKRNCPDLRKKLRINRERQGNKESDDNVSAKVARLMKWYHAALSLKGDQSQGWFIDSGATVHMCADRMLFTALDLAHEGNVTVANGEIIPVKGKGDVKLFLMNQGEQIEVTLSDVLWVPQLDGNLVSVNQLDKKGFVVEFRDGKCFFIRKNRKNDDCRL